MKSIFTILIFFVFNTLYSQDVSRELFDFNEQKTLDAGQNYKKLVDNAVILNIKKNDYKTIFENKSKNLSIDLPVSANQSVTLRLERFEVLSPDAKTIERTKLGDMQVDLRNLVLSYRGEIDGSENSFAVISFYDDKIVSVIRYGAETFVIGPLSDKSGKETEDYILYSERNLKNKNHLNCGSEVFGVPEEIQRRIKEINNKQLDLGTAVLLDAKIAVDVDYFTYTSYGSSVPNASAYALAIMSATSAVYAKDMNIKLTVGYLRVWTVQDPYTSDDGGILLDQFRFDWIATQGGVERVVAHLITRRSLNVGGIAYVNVLCNTNVGYGLSAITGTLNQLPAYSYDVVVVAHEIGHNFGSPHTHSCSWVGGPIDTCYFVEGGCYNGPLHPTAGTIMSYCDTEGGTVVMDFGQQPEALIRDRAENAACILTSTNPVFTAYPNGGETFRTLNSARIFWGTSLTGNVNIEYTTDNGGSWSTIQNNVPAASREYTWTVPYIATTIQAKVRILDSGNPAVGDTSDAAFRIILSYIPFNVISPPNLTRIETSPTGTSIHRFVWGSTGTHPSLRYKFKIRRIGTTVDYVFTSDNGGSDTAISLRNSLLDSLALILGPTGDSVRCSWRGWAYNGYDSTQSATTFIVTLKRTGVGVNVISSVIPDKFNLENNYPNPFNPSTVIRFDVAKLQQVKISVFDLLGREVVNLVNEKLQPGSYEVRFTGSEFSTGVYYYRMETQEFVQTKKMLLVK